VTSGWFSGPNGRRFWAPYLAFIAVALLVALVNATSNLLEAARDGYDLPVWMPFVWEFSSFAVNLATTPAVAFAIARVPFQRGRLARAALTHLALTIPYSLVHVGGMVALRKIVYAAADQTYDFSHGVLPLVLVYEWRKDVLAYALIAMFFWVAGVWADRGASTPGPAPRERLEIREDGRTLFLDPADIALVEAAGNYVEIHVGPKPHLVRGTIGGYETQLAGHGFVRAHRSRLINRAHIRALKPTPAGDVEIILADGRSVLGSRRYRAALTGDAAQV